MSLGWGVCVVYELRMCKYVGVGGGGGGGLCVDEYLRMEIQTDAFYFVSYLLLNTYTYITYVNSDNWYMLGHFATDVYNQCTCDINCIHVLIKCPPSPLIYLFWLLKILLQKWVTEYKIESIIICFSVQQMI